MVAGNKSSDRDACRGVAAKLEACLIAVDHDPTQCRAEIEVVARCCEKYWVRPAHPGRVGVSAGWELLHGPQHKRDTCALFSPLLKLCERHSFMMLWPWNVLWEPRWHSKCPAHKRLM